MTQLAPHQQRVVDEKNELAERLTKLNEFLVTEKCISLPFDERCLLAQQAKVMEQYLDILLDRIEMFYSTATTKGE